MPDNIVSIDYRRHLRLEPGDVMLDLGSGNGRHTIEACRWPCRVVSVDVDAEELRKARYFLRSPEEEEPFNGYGPEERGGMEGGGGMTIKWDDPPN